MVKKTPRLVGGSLSWSETPYFHKGGPLRMVPKLPLSAEMKGFLGPSARAKNLDHLYTGIHAL